MTNIHIRLKPFIQFYRQLCTVRLTPLPSSIPTKPNIKQPSNTFNTLPINPSIITALSQLQITTPTPIQTLSAFPIINSRPTLIAAETGAGKTLAYLAPLLTLLKRRENPSSSSAPLSSSLINPLSSVLRPRILVLVPTRELSLQVHFFSKSLSHIVKYRSRLAPSALRGRSSTSRANALSGGADLLVATPGGVELLRKQGKLFLSQLQALVLDEADELLGNERGFRPALDPLLAAAENKKVQVIYAGATIPRALEDTLKRTHSDLRVIRGKQLHKAVSSTNVRVAFVRIDGGADEKMNKAKEIVMTRRSRKQENGKILLFCDGTKRREQLVEMLRERDVPAFHLSAVGKDSTERAEDWEEFRNGQLEIPVGVCSKSYGRGIDDTKIDTVVMVDVPMTGAEYVHRMGRIRGKGRAYVLVGHKEQAIAEALFLRHVKGETVAGVEPKMAWQEYMNAGKDRIATDETIRYARRNKHARWVDERVKALGSFRGRSVARQKMEENELIGRNGKMHNWQRKAIKRLKKN